MVQGVDGGSAAPKYEFPSDGYDEVQEVRDRAEIIVGPWKASGEGMEKREVEPTDKGAIDPLKVMAFIQGRPL